MSCPQPYRYSISVTLSKNAFEEVQTYIAEVKKRTGVCIRFSQALDAIIPEGVTDLLVRLKEKGKK